MSQRNRNFNFSHPVVLVGGGTVNLNLLSDFAHRGWPVICADGGVAHLRGGNLVPELIIGDMDSIADIDNWRNQTQVVEIEEQDTTDFEKCLYSVAAPLYLACGFTGSRFDHTLASLHTLQKYAPTHTVLLLAGDDICLVCTQDLTIRLPSDSRFSVYPLSKTRFHRSQGLRYPLDNLVLEQGEMIGTSNRTTDNRIEVQLDYGIYALILPVKQLDEVITHLGE